MLVCGKEKWQWEMIKSEKIKFTEQDKLMFLFHIDPTPVESEKKVLLLEGCFLSL